MKLLPDKTSHAGWSLQLRPKRFDAAAIFEPYEKP
jgi:hypothetical protein